MAPSDPEQTGSEQLRRLPDGKIAAPPRYVEYDGQVIVRERYSTHQRWKNAGSHDGQEHQSPSILGSAYCRDEDEVLKPKNDHLDINEIEVYYVDDSESVVYEVGEEEPEVRTDGGTDSTDTERLERFCATCGSTDLSTASVREGTYDCGGCGHVVGRTRVRRVGGGRGV